MQTLEKTAIIENHSALLAHTMTEIPEKSSAKQLFMRRLLEDRLEVKRLEAYSEDLYWDRLM